MGPNGQVGARGQVRCAQTLFLRIQSLEKLSSPLSHRPMYDFSVLFPLVPSCAPACLFTLLEAFCFPTEWIDRLDGCSQTGLVEQYCINCPPWLSSSSSHGQFAGQAIQWTD